MRPPVIIDSTRIDSDRIDLSRHTHLLAAAAWWLLGGSVLLLTTLVPLRTELFGWTPAFWLLGAPLAVLLVLEPTLPRQLLALRHARRRPFSSQPSTRVLWH